MIGLVRPSSAFVPFDLKRRSDVARLAEAEFFLHAHANDFVCLDETQRKPDIFKVLRSVIDDNRRNGRFLILGSASRELIRQSSESLAGRLMHIELLSFLLSEVAAASKRWRRSFIRTFLERDIPQLGITIPASSIERLWRMCAHHHGQVLNLSQLGASLGVGHTTARVYVELLARTFMVRVQPPFLLNETWDDLLSYPAFGHSGEAEDRDRVQGVERSCAHAGVLERLGGYRRAEAWIAAPIEGSYPLARGVTVASLNACIRSLRESAC